MPTHFKLDRQAVVLTLRRLKSHYWEQTNAGSGASGPIKSNVLVRIDGLELLAHTF